MERRSRRGLTLIELVVVLAILVVLAALFLPALEHSNHGSRKMTCSNNLRQIALSQLEYENSYKRLTSLNCTWGYGGYSGIPFWDVAPGYSGAGRWSGIIALLAYMKDGAMIYTSIHNGGSGRFGNQEFVWGPYGSNATAKQVSQIGAKPDVVRYSWSGEYQPNRIQIGTLRCPSDPGKVLPRSQWNVARTNYAFCLGDGQVGMNSGDPAVSQTRGGFQNNMHYKISDITDGAGYVIMFGEIATPETSSFATENNGASERDAKIQGRAIYELAQQSDFKGIDVNACRALVTGWRYAGTKRNWSNLGTRAYDPVAAYTGFNTVNPPNGGSCTPTNNPWGEGDGIYTASSYHFGGAHVATFDGRVTFISEGINASPTLSTANRADFYSPGRTWADGKWNETPNWTGQSPFGVWGAMGSRDGIDYYYSEPPID